MVLAWRLLLIHFSAWAAAPKGRGLIQQCKTLQRRSFPSLPHPPPQNCGRDLESVRSLDQAQVDQVAPAKVCT